MSRHNPTPITPAIRYGKNPMKTVRTLLYVFSALFMLSAVVVFLPWDWLNAFMALFGEYV